MSIFGNSMLLKSQYISIFVFIVFLIPSISLMYQRFQGFPKGAYLLISLYPVFCAYLAKVLVSVSLGFLVNFFGNKEAMKRRMKLAALIESYTEPAELVRVAPQPERQVKCYHTEE